MSDMKPTFPPVMKMAIYLIGKVYSTCKFPCIFGSGTSHFTDVCELLTVGDMAAGGKGTGIEFASFVYEILSSTLTRRFSLTSSTFRSCT